MVPQRGFLNNIKFEKEVYVDVYFKHFFFLEGERCKLHEYIVTKALACKIHLIDSFQMIFHVMLIKPSVFIHFSCIH